MPRSARQKGSKRGAEEPANPISLSTLPHTDTAPSPPPIPPSGTITAAPYAVPPHPGPGPTAPPGPREVAEPRPNFCGAQGAQAWEPRASLPVTWTYHRPLVASASPGAPPGVGARQTSPRPRPPTLRTRRVLTCEGLRGTLPTFPTHPLPPSQRSRLGGGRGGTLSPLPLLGCPHRGGARLPPHHVGRSGGAGEQQVAAERASAARGAPAAVGRAGPGWGRPGAGSADGAGPPPVIINSVRPQPAREVSARFQHFPGRTGAVDWSWGLRKRAPRRADAFGSCAAPQPAVPLTLGGRLPL